MRKTVGQAMLTARLKAGISVYALARASGVQTNTIYCWEADKTLPTILNVAQVAEVLGLSINEYCGIPVPSKKTSN